MGAQYLGFDWILLKCRDLFTLGGDNAINVAIAGYKPNVKCDTSSTPGPAWNSCVAIFVNMRANTQPRIFGYPGDPLVEEALPFVLEGGKEAWPVYPWSRNSPTNSSVFLLG